MIYLLIIVLGYLIGSIPTAFLVVKQSTGLHIHQKGSGNVGAMNSYEVTGSKATGIIIGILDALKGMAAVAVSWHLGTGTLPPVWAANLGLIAAVAGHNYNLWLSLKAQTLVGGKGLATAAGGVLLTMPVVLPFWALLFGAGMYSFKLWHHKRDVIPGSVLACLLIPLVGYLAYGPTHAFALGLMIALILPKHLRQMLALLRTAPTE